MKTETFLILLVCFSLLTCIGGCDENITQTDETDENITPTEETNTLNEIQQGSFSTIPFSEKEIIVARDSNEFASIYDSMDNEISKDSISKLIDFKNEMVVFAFMGQQTSSGYSIEFKEDYTISDSISIGIVLKIRKDCAVEDVITYPYSIATIKKSDKEISITEETKYSCEMVTKDDPNSLNVIQQGTLYSSPFIEKEIIVARDSDEFANIYDSLNNGISKDSVAKLIDFETEMVVFAFMGQQPSTGYSIGFKEDYMIADSIRIGIVLDKPSEDCTVEDVITYPYSIATIKKSDKEVLVIESSRHSCPQ